MKLFAKPYIILIACWAVLCLPALSISQNTSQTAAPSRIILFISKNIRPYIEASDGMRDVLAEISGLNIEVVNLDKMGMKEAKELARDMGQEKNISLVVAIGPEAASFIRESFENQAVPRLYTVILNPEKVIGVGGGWCGIPLNIPAQLQLEMIHKTFGIIKRVGIFYDPSTNEQFYLEAFGTAERIGMTLVPLQVSSMREIPNLLEEALKTVDCIWLIPDKTVISESISQYIIKQAVIKRIPVVGYNQFFYESGAAMSFVFDYTAIGRQAANLAGTIVLQNKPCENKVPVFQVWLNGVVVEKLGIKVGETLEPPMMMGP